MKVFLIASAVAGALLFGCASAPLQSEVLQKSRGSLPASHVIDRVAFINQSAGHCGPASLSMVMQAAGKIVSPETLAEQMFTPGLKGSLQEDMVGAARRNGMLAIPIKNFDVLLTEVASGRPVVIFENLGLSWYPQWHYAVVVGFDFNRDEVILHSGPNAYLHERMKVFENSWKLADYWGLIVLDPGELAASVGEREHVSATVALENAGKLAEAQTSYERIITKWPESLVASIGLSNRYFSQGRFGAALTILKSAQKHHPDSEAVRSNMDIISKAMQ